ncbi:MAG: cob(I)yrinic acid a,c-diamide adenosyltransferase [Desulfuromonadaceae bacterium]|nr:cob(I)yrinic acid a,c-diamide adenosyltransferase [Desulfuromonadaceae bacterium]
MQKGLLQIYSGDGKGKTTASVGLIVRALGQGLRVLWVRLLKPVAPPSGEVIFLEGTAGLEIITAGVGIIGRKVPLDEVRDNVEQAFRAAVARITAESFDLLVIDEINNALHRSYLDLDEVLSFLDGRPDQLEVVLTGRHAPAALIDRAELVTQMEKLKHPYAAGIPARRGIEY